MKTDNVPFMSLFHSADWQSFLREGAATFGIDLQPPQLDRMSTYAAELIRWNIRKNLTAITRPREVAIKHFVDSLVPASRIPAGTRLVDIGSGGGFPGIPLKIIRPDLSILLVDASRKKVNFMKQVIRILGLQQIEAVHERIETLATASEYRIRFHIATSRAFTDLKKLWNLAHPLLKPEGRLIALKSRKTIEEIAACENLPRKPVIESYTLPFLKDRRTLVIL